MLSGAPRCTPSPIGPAAVSIGTPIGGIGGVARKVIVWPDGGLGGRRRRRGRRAVAHGQPHAVGADAIRAQRRSGARGTPQPRRRALGRGDDAPPEPEAPARSDRAGAPAVEPDDARGEHAPGAPGRGDRRAPRDREGAADDVEAAGVVDGHELQAVAPEPQAVIGVEHVAAPTAAVPAEAAQAPPVQRGAHRSRAARHREGDPHVAHADHASRAAPRQERRHPARADEAHVVEVAHAAAPAHADEQVVDPEGRTDGRHSLRAAPPELAGDIGRAEPRLE